VAKFKDSVTGLTPIGAIYGLWFLVCFMIFQLPLPIIRGGTTLSDLYHHVILPLSTVFFILLASLSTAAFMVYAEPSLKRNRVLRHFTVLFTVALGVGLFMLVRHTGNGGAVLFIIASANLIVFANLIGALIVTPLERPAELILLCVVMSLVDFFSVFAGPTKWIAESVKQYYESGMKGEVPIGDFLLVKIAVPGLGQLVPVFGIADWIIVSFFSAAVVKFGMKDNLFGQGLEVMVKNKRLSMYFPLASLGLVVAVLSAQALGLFLPALPVIAFFFLAYLLVRYPDARKLTKKDWILVFSFAGGMGLLAIILRVVKSLL